tara:strand:- start:1927 stop:2835 length:909 start_codon:yes stop_codon:yes gene_type:complete
MIIKTIKKLKLLSKCNIKIARPILVSFIYLDDFFLKLRIFLFCLFLKDDNKIVKAIKDLKKDGVAIIPNFYSENEIRSINEECLKLIDKIPLEKVNQSKNYIEGEEIDIDGKQIYLEKLGGSIKLKGLNFVNNFFNKIGKEIENNLINLIYQLSINKPYLVYNVTHDGSLKHPVFQNYSNKKNNEAIAGRPHVDLYLHKLRGFIALKDVNRDNGATVYFRKSMNSKLLRENHINLILKDFGHLETNEESHYISAEKLNELNESCVKSFIECKKGDLALLDLKTAHYAILPKEGERHLLWMYY